MNIIDLIKNFSSLYAKGFLKHVLFANAATQGVINNSRLLVDFLEHKVIVATLANVLDFAFYADGLALNWLSIAKDTDSLAGDFGDISLFQINETVGNLAERQGIGSDEVLTNTYT